MSILVTGASGFVGAHVVDALLAAGHQHVVAADLAPVPAQREDRRVTYAALDVTDASAVRAALDALRPDLVVHAAAVTPGVDDEIRDASRIVAINIGGTGNIISAAAAARVRRVVLFSSSGVYNGMPAYPDVLTETAVLPEVPSSLYAVTKLACEGLAYRAAASGLLSICAIRIASVYGQHERATDSRPAARTSQIHRLSVAAAGDCPVRISGTNAGRDWIHGADVGRAVAGLLTAPRLGHIIYNLGSGMSVPFRDMIALFRSEGLVETDDKGAPEFVMRPEDHRPPLDIARLTADTGFKPMVSFNDGIRALVAFHRERAAA